jgi:site-specific DNA recombinase
MRPVPVPGGPRPQRERSGDPPAYRADTERAATLRKELQKLGEALVATDEKPHTIVRLVADREKTRHDVEARLAALVAAPGAINLETRRLEKEARRRLTELRGLLDRNPQEARTALEALLAGPLSCAPIETPEGKRYAITGKIAVGSLFTIESVPRGSRSRVHGVFGVQPSPATDARRRAPWAQAVASLRG